MSKKRSFEKIRGTIKPKKGLSYYFNKLLLYFKR